MAPREKVNREVMGELAGDAMSMFRTNLLIIGILISAIAIAGREDTNLATQILYSNATFVGFHAWIASMVGSAFGYRRSRRLSVAPTVERPPMIGEEKWTMNIIASSAFASLGAIILFVAGFMDGFVGTLPSLLDSIVVLGLLTIIWVAVPHAFLASIDLLADRYPWLENYLYLLF